MKTDLLTLLDTAGELTATVCRNLATTNYTTRPDGQAPDDALAMAFLSDALMDDATGTTALNDRHILTSSRFDISAKVRARARMESRHAVTQTLLDLPAAYRVQLIDKLAAGGGKQERAALIAEIEALKTAILDGVTADTYAQSVS